MPRFLAFGYGLSQSLSFLDKRIAGSGNEIVLIADFKLLLETKPPTDGNDDQSVKNLFPHTDFLVCNATEKEDGTLLMFPGQGSQKIGMCVSLKNNEEARKLFRRAENVLGYNVLEICTGDEVILKEKLKSTEFVQVALFVSCLAKIEQLKASIGPTSPSFDDVQKPIAVK